MYQTYCLKIKPISSYMTPWQSDTIYGHLFWGISLIYGDEEIEKTIKEFKSGNPSFIVSDGFLGNRLPIINKEIISSEEIEKIAKDEKRKMIDVASEIKKLRKVEYVNLEIFNKLRVKENTVLKLRNEILSENISKLFVDETAHNKINRISGSTGENSIFSQKEFFSDEDIYIYINLREDYSLEKFKKLLDFLEKNGFGKKVSAGKGSIKIIQFEKFDGFKKVNGENSFIVLSNYIPKENDFDYVENSIPLVKRGKVANIKGNVSNPFKKTFTCYKAGSLFRDGREFIKGKVLENVYKNDDKIVQIGIPFIVGVEL